MPGRPPWSQPGTEGGGQTVATQERPEVSSVIESSSTQLASGDRENFNFYAPAGSIYRVKAMKLDCAVPSGAANGSHRFTVRPLGQMISLWGESDYTERVQWEYSHWYYANYKKLPPDGSAAIEQLNQLVATENSPIEVEYVNNLDVATSQNRRIQFVFEEMSY